MTYFRSTPSKKATIVDAGKEHGEEKVPFCPSSALFDNGTLRARTAFKPFEGDRVNRIADTVKIGRFTEAIDAILGQIRPKFWTLQAPGSPGKKD